MLILWIKKIIIETQRLKILLLVSQTNFRNFDMFDFEKEVNFGDKPRCKGLSKTVDKN